MNKQAILKAIEQERIITGNLKDQPVMLLSGRDAGLRMAIKIVKRLNNNNDEIDKSN